MIHIEVSAAVIKKGDLYFITQRGYGEFKDKWEFPGGKVEEGENPKDTIIREIKEELDADIIPQKELGIVEYDYPNFYIKMHVFLCKLKNEHLELLEAENAKWLKKEDIHLLDLLPPDLDALHLL